MSNFYEEVLLREEYNLVKKLQKDKEFAKYVTVSYEDRITGQVCSVFEPPVADKFPETYIVVYTMPVYVGEGKLRQDWEGEVTMTFTNSVLLKKDANEGPHVTFQSNFAPFNHHVTRSSICSGNAWVAAKDHGLWHFIISIGALINQDEFVCSEGGHMNYRAYNYWVQRKRKPVTYIKWPLDLLSKPRIKIQSKEKPKVSIQKKKEIKIVSKGQAKQPGKIKIIKKSK